MATTRSRPRGRETARPNTGGVVAEHLNKIYVTATVGVIIIIAFLALTSIGHVIDLAVQHFMLFYAGVFALITLCASVGAGLVCTDRVFLHPGQRVLMQSIHRAISFGALVFLIIHIVTEILAQRIHVIDAFIPFLVPFKTFYIGLGTISSDLIILLVITGVLRKKFTGNGKNVWRWRAIHYTSYAAFVFGVWHGLLGGRAGKPYVDWSYGFVVAIVALGLAVRILSNSLRPKETLSSPPVAESASSGSAPMRAASMYAQLGVARVAGSAPMAMPAYAGGVLRGGGSTGWTRAALPSASGYPEATVIQGSAEPLAAPVYEPGYDGPPRYAGAPRNTGPMPRVPGASSGEQPVGGQRGPASGPMPRAATGPMPRVSGPMPRAATGPMPRVSGPMSRVSGPMRRVDTGPMPRAATGPMPRVSGPMPSAGTGAMPRVPGGRGARSVGSGPMPRVPGAFSGAQPVGGQRGPASGPMPRVATGPMSRVSGPMPRAATGPMSRVSGPMPRVPGAPSGGQPVGQQQPVGRQPSGRQRRPASGPMPAVNTAAHSGGQPYAGPARQQREARQAPWEHGIPETDPRLKYRNPGPGMPGYQVTGGRYRGSGDLR